MPRRRKTKTVILTFPNKALYGAFVARRQLENKHVPLLVEKKAPKGTKSVLRRELPHYIPPMRVPRITFQTLVPITTAFALFMRFLGEESLRAILIATNEYAKPKRPLPQPQWARNWTPLTRSQLLVWLGILFYMGRHGEHDQTDFWNKSIGHHLGEYMGRTRWQQIHRYLAVNIATKSKGDPWWHPIAPMVTEVRKNCQAFVIPASWLAVDEAMVHFEGRSVHTLKMKNKPISEGFKIWVLAFSNGYIYLWLFHSHREGTETIGKTTRPFSQMPGMDEAYLAPTFQVPVELCRQIRKAWPHLQFIVFLDNLFLNVPVAHVLLNLGVALMGTTRKNAEGIPEPLLILKEEAKALIWNSLIAVVVDHSLCFLWQDNNAVLAITTAHSLHQQDDQVIRVRKRPGPKSTNAKNTLPVFGSHSTLPLPIPTAIDDYNNSMNAVDSANQLRHGFSCHKPGSRKWWKPLFYWLLDDCASNAYLFYRQGRTQTSHLHKRFHNDLIEQLLDANKRTEPVRKHEVAHYDKYQYCAYSKSKGGDCMQGSKKRKFGNEISGNAGPVKRSRQVKTGCTLCGVPLCIDTKCWDNFHSVSHPN